MTTTSNLMLLTEDGAELGRVQGDWQDGLAEAQRMADRMGIPVELAAPGCGETAGRGVTLHPTQYVVVDYQTGDALEGAASPQLVEASLTEASGCGAVRARLTGGVWVPWAADMLTSPYDIAEGSVRSVYVVVR